MRSVEVNSKNRVKRGHEHASYDTGVIFDILDSGYLCHLSFIQEGCPQSLPTLYWRKEQYVYWHGSTASRTIREMAKGIQICFNASHLDGFLLGRSAFHHSANYRSVTIHGNAEPVDEPEAKTAALDRMIESLFPGRRADLRDHRENELKSVRVLRLPIEVAAAKARYDFSIGQLLERSETISGKEFAEANDETDCWTGLIPIRQLSLEPVSDAPGGKDTEVPEYLKKLRFKQEF